MSTAQNSYDEIPYGNYCHRRTHPRRLEARAVLFGMEPPPVLTARVLEIGCAAGANLIPIAVDYPEAQFVGIDLSARQIEAGQEVVASLNLRNIELRHKNILDVDESWGQFDYILCHGVFSWVPPNVQDKILSICDENLSPNGVAFISYNIYPGWHFRGIARDLMRFHVAELKDPNEAICQAKAALNFLAQCTQPDSTMGKTVRTELDLIVGQQDAYIFHEHLEENNHPILFFDFVRRAQETRLQFLCEAELIRMTPGFLPEEAKSKLQGVPLIQQQQYMDYLCNSAFRNTLLCHQAVGLEFNLTPDIMKRFYMGLSCYPKEHRIDVSSDDSCDIKISSRAVSTERPFLKAALKHLIDIYPAQITLDELNSAAARILAAECNDPISSPAATSDTAENILLVMLLNGILDISVHPPRVAAQVGARPAVSPLVRMQAAEGNAITNQLHDSVKVNDFVRDLVRRLDGHHDRDWLLRETKKFLARSNGQVQCGGRDVKPNDKRMVATMLDATLLDCRKRALLNS